MNNPDSNVSALPVSNGQPEDSEIQGLSLEHPAVLVVRKPGEQPGQFVLEIVEFNGADPMATPMLLRVAASMRQSQLEPR